MPIRGLRYLVRHHTSAGAAGANILCYEMPGNTRGLKIKFKKTSAIPLHFLTLPPLDFMESH